MNDRYLFRAKRIDNGEWVEGYYVLIDVYHYIYTGNLYNGGLYVVAERFEIDIDTLCPCTGLKDKNGNLVWENDVVRIKYDDDFSVVGWIKYSNCGVRYNFVFGTEIYGIDDSCDIEVIGNIFDNPELINE